MDYMDRVNEVRTSFLKSDIRRDKKKRAPETVERYCDIPYGTDSVWQLLDLYRPKDREGEMLPVIVSIHGGGWVYGSKAIYQFYGMSMAERGFAFVNFTYRLAPEHKFPATLQDTNLVMKWIRENRKTYGLDTDNIFVLGDSAGGNYTGLFASIYTNPDYAKKVKIRPLKGITIRGVGLNCGYYSALDGAENELFDALLPGGTTQEGLQLLDVPSNMTENFPPAYIFSANKDFLKPQARLIKARLDELGVKNKCKIYGNRETQLYHVFHVDVSTESAKQCNDDQAKFFKSLIVKED